MTREEWDLWQHETALVESLLGPIEAQTTSVMDRALIARLRRALTLRATNPREAAYCALLVGLRTGDAVRAQILRPTVDLGLKVRRKNRLAAQVRGVRIRDDSARDDERLRAAHATYRRQYPVHSQRRMAAALAKQLNRKENAVRAALRRLGLS